MPPKPRLYKAATKNSSQNSRPVPLGASNAESQTPQLSPEVEQQFEVELCWCIKQLQIALKSGKLNQKQIQDHTKAHNTLTSSTAPLIKKRQVMRLSFGDYRAKMQTEEAKQKSKVLRITVSPAKPNSKSVFIKKSHILLNSGSNFRFDFKTPEEEIKENQSDMKTALNKSTDELFHFTTSKNEFRFDFSADSDIVNNVS